MPTSTRFPAAPFLLLLAGALLALTTGGCSTVQIDEQFVFMPKKSVTPATFDRPGITLNEVNFSVDDTVTVNAWHLTQPDARGTVLFFGGQGFYLVHSGGYIDALTRHGLNVFMMDYRGYGKSGGSPAVQALKRDALAAYDVLVDSLGADPNRLVVHGHSMGSFLAPYTVDRRSAAGLVLENPVTNADDWVSQVAPWWLRLALNFEVDKDLRGEDNLPLLRETRVPLLVLGGTEDFVTPPAMAKKLHDAAPTPDKQLVVIEGGGHNRLYDQDAYHEAYDQLLQQVSNRAQTSPGPTQPAPENSSS
jgi:hypothetical protein